jgi:hypothetical protein
MPTPHEDILESKRLYDEHRARTQAFFAQLATEMRRPSFGDMAKSYFQPLLMRATEAQLYIPEVTNG